MDKIDINIIQLNKQEFNNLQASQLILEFNGSTVNTSLINTFRRLSLDSIPTYAFVDDLIQIEENTSIFNNDYMRLRLSQITIPKINVPFAYVPDKYWRYMNYGNPDRDKYPEDKKILEMYLNITNDSQDVLNVTSNHLKIFEDGNEKAEKFDQKYPHLLVQLRPKESFKFRALAALGVGKRNNIWSAAAQSFFTEIDKNRFKLSLESQGQFDEYEILHKGCQIIKIKLGEIRNIIEKNYNIPSIINEDSLIIKLQNEDHTIGNVLNEFLQNNKNILFSGLSKPDLLLDEIIIKFISVNPNPLIPFFQTIDYIINIFSEIEKQLLKLGNKYINYLQKK
ncbi:DNA-directed RNA polymerase [uncultured virus]|nr:DNA-directed RNA polymerase [uncultured virus]